MPPFYLGGTLKIMNFKTIKDSVLFYISVPKCVGCKIKLSRSDVALCPDCLKEYDNIKQRNCSICAKPLDFCTCTNKYLDSHYIHKLIKVFRYVQREPLPSNNLIYSLKRDNRRDVLEFLSRELIDAISHSIINVNECVFTNVPRRREARSKYGFDHAKLLAKYIANHFSAQYYQPIISKAKISQKKTLGRDRIKNATFKLKTKTKDLTGKTVIIVDDIVTTGSSMGACATLIRALGAKRIIGAAISIAYKDMYTPINREDRFYSNTK